MHQAKSSVIINYSICFPSSTVSEGIIWLSYKRLDGITFRSELASQTHRDTTPSLLLQDLFRCQEEKKRLRQSEERCTQCFREKGKAKKKHCFRFCRCHNWNPLVYYIRRDMLDIVHTHWICLQIGVELKKKKEPSQEGRKLSKGREGLSLRCDFPFQA